MTDRADSPPEGRVLVPRGGALGQRLAELLSARGYESVIAPVIDFEPPVDSAPLDAALHRLAQGHYDWLAVTSATTVAALAGIQMPESTRVAAVGTGTASALRAAGIPVDYVPLHDQSAVGMLAGWPEGGARVLVPQSAIAAPTLADGLRTMGLAVDAVTAYRTVPVALGADVIAMAADGRLDAVALTSASVVREIASQLASHAPASARSMAMVCIGAPTASAVRAAGLTVAAVASHASADGLVDAIDEVLGGARDSDSPGEGF